jgi:hypothetical protein
VLIKFVFLDRISYLAGDSTMAICVGGPVVIAMVLYNAVGPLTIKIKPAAETMLNSINRDFAAQEHPACDNEPFVER